MTPIADLELSRQLSALRVPPPNHGFEARLRAALYAEAPVASQPRARVLRVRALRRPLAVLAVGTFAFAGAAAAALDGRVWRAIVAATGPSTPVLAPRGVPERPERARRVERALVAAPATELGVTPSAAPELGATERARSPLLLNPPAPPTAATPPLTLPAPTPAELHARHPSWTRPEHPEATSSRRDRTEPPPSHSAASPASPGVPRLDLGDLPRASEHAAPPGNDGAASERLRDLARTAHPAEGARERATEARERAAERNRGAERPRRPVDTPRLDVERERRGSEARDQQESNREGRTEHGRSEREGH